MHKPALLRPISSNLRAIVFLGWIAAFAIAADSKSPAIPTVRGTLVKKTSTVIEVLPEGEKITQRFVYHPPGLNLDPRMQAFMDTLILGSEVQIGWTNVGNGRQLTSVIMLGKPGTFGLIAGNITAIGDKFDWIELTDDASKAEKFGPVWTRAGPSKDLIRAISRRMIGDRVEIRKFTDDHVRLASIRLLALAPGPTTMPADLGGVVYGKVVRKTKDTIVIQGDDGQKETYIPQRIVGSENEVDKDVLRMIGQLAVGQRVEAHWFLDDTHQLFGLKLASAARPATRPAAAR